MPITEPGIDRLARNAQPTGYFRDWMGTFDDMLDRFPFELVRINCDSHDCLPWLLL
jgi:hypothetical protein